MQIIYKCECECKRSKFLDLHLPPWKSGGGMNRQDHLNHSTGIVLKISLSTWKTYQYLVSSLTSNIRIYHTIFWFSGSVNFWFRTSYLTFATQLDFQHGGAASRFSLGKFLEQRKNILELHPLFLRKISETTRGTLQGCTRVSLGKFLKQQEEHLRAATRISLGTFGKQEERFRAAPYVSLENFWNNMRNVLGLHPMFLWRNFWNKVGAV